MVVGITDEVDVRSSYKDTSGGSDGARTEETAVELILIFFFCVYLDLSRFTIIQILLPEALAAMVLLVRIHMVRPMSSD